MKNSLLTSLLLGGIGVFGGMFIASGQKDLSKVLSILGLSAIPTAYITNIIAETRASRRLNEVERTLKDAQKTASEFDNKNQKLISDNANLNQTLRNLALNKKQLQEQLTININELTGQLGIIGLNLSQAEKELPIRDNQINLLQADIAVLNSTLSEHKQELEQVTSDYTNQLEELQVEITVWENTFHESVEKHSQEKFLIARKNELERVYTEHDAIVLRYQQTYDKLLLWIDKVRTNQAGKNAFMMEMTNDFNNTLDTVSGKIKVQEDAFLEEIELLREKVAVLQQQKDGEILESEFMPRDFNRATDISNGIANTLKHYYQIPLRVNGYEETEAGLRVGYSYSKSFNPQMLLDIFEKDGKDITRSLGLYSINASIDKLSPTFILSIKSERPKPPTDEQIYKDGLIPASQFCDQLFLATDHRKQGKPTLRVMAATGDGKGIAVKNLLNYFTEQDKWEIWLSDPVSDSSEDYWHCPKMAKGVNEAGKAYSMFADLHKARQAKAPTFTERFVLGVFDEFDKQHSEDDKESAANIMTAIRHTNQRQILIGQCAEVGANSWTWDAMNNCALLALGNSIGTIIKHLSKDMGWTISKVNTLKREHEKFKGWANAKNDLDPDRPNENAYRIALLIVGDKYSFLEVPSAHKGILRDGKGVFRDGLTTKQLQVQTVNTPSVPVSKSAYPKKLEGEYKCPDCSHHTQTFSDTTTKGTPRYVCDNCGKKAVISKFKKIS